jgi:DNA-binding transcriptional regulator YdaS (Cro superfamily)
MKNSFDDAQKVLVKDIAAKVGGVVALGKKLGLSKGAVSQWDKVPTDRVLAVEKLTGVSRHVMRPDIFGAAPQHEQEAA